MDPDAIKNPQFDDCTVPIVWWPWWPYNPGDFFLSSLAPFHAMQHEGVIDHNVRYTPVLDGLSKPGYMQWYFDPITNHPVQSLEELLDRSNAGSRCFERMLMCKPYSLWYLSPGRQWHDRLKFGMLGQEVNLLNLLTLYLLICIDVALVLAGSGIIAQVWHAGSRDTV